MVEGVYKPRKPNASPLYQSISDHFSEFESVYKERYQNKEKLSQCAYCLKEFFQTTLNRKEAVPGAVISIQTFGDLVNFHPHLYCLVTDGCFMPNGWFYVLPEINVKKLESLFRHKFLKLLLSEKKISEELVEKLLSWKNSGFSIHHQSKSKAGTAKAGPSISSFSIFAGENDLPATDKNGSLSL